MLVRRVIEVEKDVEGEEEVWIVQILVGLGRTTQTFKYVRMYVLAV